MCHLESFAAVCVLIFTDFYCCCVPFQLPAVVVYLLMCHILKVSRMCRIPKVSRMCRIPEVFRMCRIPEVFRMCHIPKVSRMCRTPKVSRMCCILEVSRICHIPKVSGMCHILSWTTILPTDRNFLPPHPPLKVKFTQEFNIHITC